MVRRIWRGAYMRWVIEEAFGDGILEALQVLVDDTLLFEKHDEVL
jgi:cyanate lyase